MNRESKTEKSFLAFTKRLASSRLGQILFVFNLTLAIYALAQRGFFSDQAFHFHYESLLLKSLFLLNLPSLVVASIITSPLTQNGSYLATYWWASWVSGVVSFIIISMQWWLIGYWLEHLIQDKTFKSDSGSQQR